MKKSNTSTLEPAISVQRSENSERSMGRGPLTKENEYKMLGETAGGGNCNINVQIWGT